MATIRSAVLIALLATLATACAAPSGKTPEEKRTYALAMKKNALEGLYAVRPEIKPLVESALGHAVFSNFSIHPGLLTLAGGYGVIEEHGTGENTHVKLFRFGVGPGLAIKGYNLLLIIRDPNVLKQMKSGKWSMGGFSEASFKFGDFGGGVAGTVVSAGGVDAFLWTHTGFALELTLSGARVFRDMALN